jgi:hypothetical protein
MNIITGLCMYGIGSHAKQVPGSMAAVSWCDADVKEGLLTFG